MLTYIIIPYVNNSSVCTIYYTPYFISPILSCQLQYPSHTIDTYSASLHFALVITSLTASHHSFTLTHSVVQLHSSLGFKFVQHKWLNSFLCTNHKNCGRHCQQPGDKHYIFDTTVETFVKPIAVIPDMGGAPNGYFVIKDRSDWA